MVSPRHSQSLSSACSPSFTNSQLPQPPKRRMSDMASTPVIKRRKASMISITSTSSAHPLRQTSFPPQTDVAPHSPQYSRSPSVDISSILLGPVTAGKRKKAAKFKGKDNDNLSIPGVRAKSASVETSKGKGKGNAEHIAEEDDEDAGQELEVAAAESTKEERAKEERRRHLLTRAFNTEQWQRYEAWRSSKLPDAVVRRIVNQTLSQSAPQQVILAVRSVAKIFAGDMIERARKVQTEWLEASGEDQTTGLPSPPAEDGMPKEKEKRRGPLMPDHLREAFRRHMLSDEGLVGQLGLWQLQQQSGVERFAVRVGGKRLLK